MENEIGTDQEITALWCLVEILLSIAI